MMVQGFLDGLYGWYCFSMNAYEHMGYDHPRNMPGFMHGMSCKRYDKHE